MAVAEQLGDAGGWHVQLAALWPWYLPSGICITLIECFIVSVQSFKNIFLVNLLSINKMEWSTIPALCALLTGVILKGK